MVNPAEQALINQKTQQKATFNTIANGTGFVNPMASIISGLTTRTSTLIIASNAMVSNPEITLLVTNLTNLNLSLADLLAHTNVLSGVAEPVAPASPYNFQTRTSILQSALTFHEQGIDTSDTQTAEDKVEAFLGSLSTTGMTLTTNISNSLSALEAVENIYLSFIAEAIVQNPIMVALIADISTLIGNEDTAVDIEITRLRHYTEALNAISMTKVPVLSNFMSSVSSPDLKTDLGIT